MRSCWAGLGPNPIISVLIRRGDLGHRDKWHEKMEAKVGGVQLTKDTRTAHIPGSWEDAGGTVPWSLQRLLKRLLPRPTSILNLWTRELWQQSFVSFKPGSSGDFAMGALGNRLVGDRTAV